MWIKTFGASVSAALFRIFLMPVDTVKTTLQVEGKDGLKVLGRKFKAGGPTIFYHGSIGAAVATLVGHYPWFATFNTLQANIPTPKTTIKKMGRNAGIGFVASVISDSCSNSIRVLKTYRQTSKEVIS